MLFMKHGARETCLIPQLCPRCYLLLNISVCFVSYNIAIFLLLLKPNFYMMVFH